ncbi:hypothetical protein [Nocardia sp. alder85J]|uniref:hypothetical protein n=1 Tax=Nocardia sp. alder85J TaxID=2862949 RepID=UPI001CD70CF5|nr:hypothetical protein [Nocardia sp. alder85J]MCX4094944.1 hypothetical protein [Nocardia sp. alder85J]
MPRRCRGCSPPPCSPGPGRGSGSWAGLSLLNATVPAERLAEANAALNVGGYLPAGLLPVTAGYLGDALGLPAATTVFGAVVVALALVGGRAARTAVSGEPIQAGSRSR